MPNSRTSTRRSKRLHPVTDVDRYLEEWVATLDEMHELSEDELEDLMRLVANDDAADDDH